MAHELNVLENRSSLGRLVNRADHLKIAPMGTSVDLNQLNLTAEEKRYWGMDEDAKF